MLRALDLVEALDGGDLTPRGVVELISEAVDAREGDIHAFAHLDLDALRVAAQATGLRGPLGGLPVAFKDIIDTADMPTQHGSPIYAGWRPKADATIVSMTLAAGGLNLGKAATCEFAALQPAVTRNPHDRTRTPGGSSAGSAAGVAAGMMPLAFGTQTAGSVIRPASYCGVAAIKPSFRLLPMVGVKPSGWTLDTLGLFGARVVDVAFGLAAITRRDLCVHERDFGTPTYGVMRQTYAGMAEPDSEAALQFAIRALEKAGARIVDVAPPAEWAAADAAQTDLYYWEAVQSLAWEYRHHADRFSAALRERMDLGALISTERYDECRRLAKRARRATPQAFTQCDAILTFSSQGAAPDRSTTGNSLFNRLVTLLGLPAVNVPGYRTADGLPVGVQVVASFGADRTALATAAYVERALAAAI